MTLKLLAVASLSIVAWLSSLRAGAALERYRATKSGKAISIVYLLFSVIVWSLVVFVASSSN